jgi:flagellar motility protein MotE (MotC chaperone)
VAKNIGKEIETVEETRAKPFQKFLLLVLIPLLIVITLGLIIATATGVNVFEKAKSYTAKIPIVGSLAQKENISNIKNIEKNVNELQNQLNDRNSEITQLQEKLDSKDTELQKAKLDNSQLQQDIKDLNAAQKESKRALKDIVSTYETMSPKKSAPIIAKMADAEALKILTNVKPEVLAAIMENMDPTQAARFTVLMTNTDASSSQQSTP